MSIIYEHLAKRSQEETQRYLNGQPYDERPCFELFRYALQERNEYCWELLYSLYKRQVSSWVMRHSQFRYCDEEPCYFVNRAFERMWRAITPEKFEKFTTVAELLRYLQMCVVSAISDYKPPPLAAPEETLFSQPSGDLPLDECLCRQEFWTLIESYINTEAERLLVTGYFQWGFTPKQLCAEYPEIFDKPQDINRVKTAFVSRLKRNLRRE